MVINFKLHQMKQNIFFPVLLLCAMLLGACKKDKVTEQHETVITAKEFSFNMAVKAITPDTEINGDITSGAGIKQVYGYLVRRDKTDSLVYRSVQDAINQQQFHFSIPTASFAAANLEKVEGIKIMVKNMDNSTHEGFVKVTSFSPPLPQLKSFPASLLPDADGKIVVAGTASSENGLKDVAIYDDYQGTDALVEKISLDGKQTSYKVNYTYSYRKNAANLKVIVTDNFGLTATTVIKIPLRSYNLYQDIDMMANGTAASPSPSSFFMGETGTVIGSCSISGQERNMDFLGYCTSAFVYTFYSPTNTSSIAKNYKCGALSWEPNAGDLNATRFRVLVPGAAAVDAIYAAYNANAITDLDDAFFADVPVPGGSTAKFDANIANQSTSTFNLTTAYLIWVRVPKADGVSFRNELIRVKAVNIGSTAALATIKFDILVSK